jgi:hypothetical protein
MRGFEVRQVLRCKHYANTELSTLEEYLFEHIMFPVSPYGTDLALV